MPKIRVGVGRDKKTKKRCGYITLEVTEAAITGFFDLDELRRIIDSLERTIVEIEGN